MTRRDSVRTLVSLGVAALCALLPAASGMAAGGGAGKRVRAVDAAQHAGEEAVVCGAVAGAKYAGKTRGQPTFLDFEKPYPGEAFRVVIWSSDRERFKEPPERAYAAKSVCVSGKIQLYRGVPEIVVHDPAQLSLDSRAGGGA